MNSQGSYQTVIQIGKNDACLGLEVLRLAVGESWEGESGATEAGLVPLSGKFAVSINGAPSAQWSGVGGRPDMFSATPWAVYVPRQSSFKVTAETKLELIIAKAPCEKNLPPAIVKPEDVRVVNAGAANWRRDVRLVIPPGSPLSQRLIIGEVNITAYKVMAFTISSFFAGIAGAMYSYTMGYIHPEHFTLLLSVQYLAMIIVGGLGTILGSIFGAVFIVLVPELIKAIARASEMFIPALKGKYDEEWNIAAFGLLIMIFLVFEAEGLYGIWGRIKTSFKNWPYTY